MPKPDGNNRGRRGGPREQSEFDQRVVDIARVARVVAGGRRFRFRATVVSGNKNGKVGVGVAKGADVSAAIQKATERSKKTMVQIVIVDGTIPYEITKKQTGANIFLKPAREGTGIIAGGPVRAVLEMAGIKNILSKMLGSHNKTNNAIATYKALRDMEDPKVIASQRGKELGSKKKAPQTTESAKTETADKDTSKDKDKSKDDKKDAKPDKQVTKDKEKK